MTTQEVAATYRTCVENHDHFHRHRAFVAQLRLVERLLDETCEERREQQLVAERERLAALVDETRTVLLDDPTPSWHEFCETELLTDH